MPSLPPYLAIGKHRKYGLKILPELRSHVAVSGLCAMDPFSGSSLAFALRSLHPPVRVLAVGGAYTDGEADEARKVWDEYRREVMMDKESFGDEEDTRTAFIRVQGVMEGGPHAVAEFLKAELEKQGFHAVSS